MLAVVTAWRPRLTLPTSRAFDVADELEGGLARESMLTELEPSPPSPGLQRGYVTVSQDGCQYSLYNEASESFVLYATVTKDLSRVDIFTYRPSDPLFDMDRPAASMFLNGDQWTAVLNQCEHCVVGSPASSCSQTSGHSQQIAHGVHRLETVGDGKVNSMHVTIPGRLSDGSRVVWCPRRGLPSLSHATESRGIVKIPTRLPEWSKTRQTLELDFKGRMIQSSARNFQLLSPAQSGELICQFGKVKDPKYQYILDFKAPLSSVQAFAAALSTVVWQ
mmetsp:Transcript_29232/g.70974  ORF Transcript_29232/g.70974 Transcript_29232/m.70974 type:complete len:277 (-) Transcript_29232:225-1055(-)